MKVVAAKVNSGISVFPNPATAGNLNLKFQNEPPGTYEVRLINSFGQTCLTKSIQYSGGLSSQNLKGNQNLPSGIYRLEIKTPAGEKRVMSVVF